ncbi:MAG TPA: MerR family transcriptional regulator [Streptosporangiaceae bacterium]|nr:MerR family transcriptional regulator [Streptosporangiaceae bacterium]
MPDELLTIGELARRAGRRTSSIRYYEEIGLLPEAVRVGGKRRYPPGTASTLKAIAAAQRAGLSLREIKAAFGAAPGEHGGIEEFRRVAAAKLPQATAAIEHATAAREWLEHAAACECLSLRECPLLGEDHERSA